MEQTHNALQEKGVMDRAMCAEMGFQLAELLGVKTKQQNKCSVRKSIMLCENNISRTNDRTKKETLC